MLNINGNTKSAQLQQENGVAHVNGKVAQHEQFDEELMRLAEHDAHKRTNGTYVHDTRRMLTKIAELTAEHLRGNILPKKYYRKIVETINEERIYIAQEPNEGEIIRRCIDRYGRHYYRLSSSVAMKKSFSNVFIPRGEGNVNAYDFWMRSTERREVFGIEFAPGAELGKNWLNLWTGFAVEPKKGDWSLYEKHMREVIASGIEERYKYLEAYLADTVQHLAKLPEVAIVMRGGSGVGKGVFVQEFGKLFGHSFRQLTQSRQLLGNFNMQLQGAIVAYADEAVWAGDKSGEGPLKALITEEKLMIEPKGREVYEVKNYMRLFVASNKSWVVPVEKDDRRFFVIDVSDKYQQNDEYFDALLAQMNNGGREALLYHLLYEVKSGAINLKRLERTEAHFEQIYESLPSVEKWLLNFLKTGELTRKMKEYVGDWNQDPVAVAKEQLHEVFCEWCRANDFRRLDEEEFGRRLKRLIPYTDKKDRKPVKANKDDTRQSIWVYCLPNLAECREYIIKALRLKANYFEEQVNGE